MQKEKQICRSTTSKNWLSRNNPCTPMREKNKGKLVSRNVYLPDGSSSSTRISYAGVQQSEVGKNFKKKKVMMSTDLSSFFFSSKTSQRYNEFKNG